MKGLDMLISHALGFKKSSTIKYVSPSDTLAEAALMLAQNNIGAMPVSEDGIMIHGVISERDIVKALADKAGEPLHSEVRDYMTSSVKKCKETDLLRNVIKEMNKGHFRHIPVVDENDKMIEFISISDLVLAHLNEVEAENAAMRSSVTDAPY